MIGQRRCVPARKSRAPPIAMNPIPTVRSSERALNSSCSGAPNATKHNLAPDAVITAIASSASWEPGRKPCGGARTPRMSRVGVASTSARAAPQSVDKVVPKRKIGTLFSAAALHNGAIRSLPVVRVIETPSNRASITIGKPSAVTNSARLYADLNSRSALRLTR